MFNFYGYHSLQEAKSSCAGQWYLPAGRMEPGEEVAEAAIREVKEETGLDFEPTNLLQIETAGTLRHYEHHFSLHLRGERSVRIR